MTLLKWVIVLATNSQWTLGVIITPLLPQNDVATSFRRNDDAIITRNILGNDLTGRQTVIISPNDLVANAYYFSRHSFDNTA